MSFFDNSLKNYVYSPKFISLLHWKKSKRRRSKCCDCAHNLCLFCVDEPFRESDFFKGPFSSRFRNLSDNNNHHEAVGPIWVHSSCYTFFVAKIKFNHCRRMRNWARTENHLRAREFKRNFTLWNVSYRICADSAFIFVKSVLAKKIYVLDSAHLSTFQTTESQLCGSLSFVCVVCLCLFISTSGGGSCNFASPHWCPVFMY